ncbi:MAG TPA: hypothetical protein PK691_07195 [Thermomicrobiales bacterium]|nr:hypothetical protein [Thermomicrobiales bacterium]HRA48267.1 hypothetical protein [Thermomicrobiales bacterium]
MLPSSHSTYQSASSSRGHRAVVASLFLFMMMGFFGGLALLVWRNWYLFS